MSLAFVSLAAANAAAFFALRQHTRGIAGRLGLGLFLVAAIGSRGEGERARPSLVALTLVTWPALIVWNAGSSLQYRAADGPSDAYEWIGYPNRIFIVSDCIWLIVAVWGARESSDSAP